MELLRATDTRYNGSSDLLAQIDARITELSREQSELQKFHERDRERRALEYTIYQRELAELAEALEAVRRRSER